MGQIHLHLSFPVEIVKHSYDLSPFDIHQASGQPSRAKNEEAATRNCPRNSVSSLMLAHQGFSNEEVSLPEDNGSLFQPRLKRDEDLPFLPAAEVARRHGRDGARLCVHCTTVCVSSTLMFLYRDCR